jgi:hypothetical protein
MKKDEKVNTENLRKLKELMGITLIDELEGKGIKGEAAVTKREEIKKQIKELSEKEEAEREEQRLNLNKESLKIQGWTFIEESTDLSSKTPTKNTTYVEQLSNVINNTSDVIGSVIGVLKNNILGNGKDDSSNKNLKSPEKTKGGLKI